MRIGVIGLGRVGMMHARNLAQTPGVDDVVLLGRNPDRVAASRDELRHTLAPGSPAELTGYLAPETPPATVSLGGGLAEGLGTLDGVVIATTTRSHPDLALQAARAGVPALVEKPLTLDADRLNELADELDELNADVMVAFHRRYDPAHQELRRRLRAGDAGRIRAVTATGHDHYALDPSYIPVSGGMWLDMLIHDFDAIPWVTGQQVKSVWATGSVLDAPEHAAHNDVDSALAVLVLESGAVATVSGLRKNGAGQDVRLEVFGSVDTYAAGFDDRLPVTSTEPGAVPPAAHYDQFIERFERAFRAESRAFVDLVEGKPANLTPPREGLASVRIAVAAAESLRTGTTIDLD